MSKIYLQYIFFVLLFGIAGGCLDFTAETEEDAEEKRSSYDVQSSVDRHGVRHDQIQYTASAGDDTHEEDLLATVNSILREEQKRVEASSAPKRKPAVLLPAEREIRKPPHSHPSNESLGMRRKRFAQLIQTPDPSAFRELRDTLLNPDDVLSALAGSALTALGGIEVEQVLEKALADKRFTVRKVALGGLVSMRAPAAAQHCRRVLQQDPRADVRTVAVTGLGMLRDDESLLLLRSALKDSAFNVRFYAAWALGRLQDAQGLRVLERYAASNDTTMAPQAIRLLGSLQNSDTVPVLYQCLFARRDPVWRAAVEVLGAFPPETLAMGLEKMPAKKRKQAQLQFAMLRGLTGAKPIPVECHILALRGTRDEKILALRCLGVAGSLSAIPTAIQARNDPDGTVQIAAETTLASLVKRHKRTPPSGKNINWHRWWFEQHYILSASTAEAVLLLPSGEKRRVRPGTHLEPDAVITRIKAGSGLKHREGAQVMVQAAGARIELYSCPER